MTTFPDSTQPELLARLQLGHRGAGVEAADELLFHAIRQRRTNRRAFSNWPVPEPLLAALESAAAIHGAWLQVIRGPRQYHEVAELIAEGGRLTEANPAFMRERAGIARWSQARRCWPFWTRREISGVTGCWPGTPWGGCCWLPQRRGSPHRS